MRRVLLFGKLLFLGIRGLNSLTFTFKLTQANYLKFATRAHGSHFPRLNQPSVKKKKEITNEKVKKIAASSVRVELKTLFREEKIDKLERECKRLQCESAGLKRIIQTLRRSIGKCLLKQSSSRL